MRYLVIALVLFLASCGSAPATNAPTAVLLPTAAPTQEPPTVVPEPTTAPTAQPTAEPPTAAPAPESDTVRYIRIAKAGVAIPLTRTDHGQGEWKVLVFGPGDISLTMPVSIGLSNDQTVRQAKRQISQAVKALFDGDVSLTQINVIGTTPYGGSETPAVSIVVARAAYAAWDGAADTLGKWNVSQRLN